MKLHHCTASTPTMGFEENTEGCVELADFTLWVRQHTGQFQVNVCPFCGFTAAIKIGEPPHKHVTATQSRFSKQMERDIKNGVIRREVAEAFRKAVDEKWEEDVLNNPHIKRLHGAFMDPSITSDRIKLMVAVHAAEDEEADEYLGGE